MSRKPITDTQLSEAKKTLDQAANRYKDLRAQHKAVLRKEKKKQEDRRKILAGAAALTLMQTDAEFAALFSTRLRSYLTREIDRAAFPELFTPKS